MRTRTVYLPLTTYPEPASNESIIAALRLTEALHASLHVTTFAVNIPQLNSPLGDFLIDVPALVRAAEERSMAECRRICSLVKDSLDQKIKLQAGIQEISLGGANDAAAVAARYHDLTVLPWAPGSLTLQEMAEAIIFGSGRPAILVPPSFRSSAVQHVAVAWDASRVAARALWDALPFVPASGQVSVLTVSDEKPLAGPDLAARLARVLEDHSVRTQSLELTLSGRPIAAALQAAASELGADMLVMGGFGHSRLRDFVLGGATKGVLTELKVPVMLSH